MSEFCIVLTTCSKFEEASKIAEAVVAEKSAACVNIIPGVRSIYRWEGKVADDREWLLLIKTRAERFAAVEAKVKALHSYQVPEVIALPIVAGAEGYMRWLRGETE